MIPVARPDIGPEEVAAVTAVLESGMLAAGRRVVELEERFAAFIGTRHAIAVSNGTVALMCLFEGLGLGARRRGHHGRSHVQRDGQLHPVHRARRRSSSTSSPTRTSSTRTWIEAAITPRTKAICPVHLFGLPADMDAIGAIADRHGLAVVEDACQAHGAQFGGRRAGSFGHGAFSLYGTKNMTTGEGGLITTDDDRLADWIRLYRNQGMRERYHHEVLGYNFRLTDIAAAIGLCQLDKLERNTARRQEIAHRYDAAFADLPVRVPVTPAGRTHVFHQYTIAVEGDRDGLVAELAGAGVSTGYLLPDPGPSPAVRSRARDPGRPAADRSGVASVAVAADVPRAAR